MEADQKRALEEWWKTTFWQGCWIHAPDAGLSQRNFSPLSTSRVKSAHRSKVHWANLLRMCNWPGIVLRHLTSSLVISTKHSEPSLSTPYYRWRIWCSDFSSPFQDYSIISGCFLSKDSQVYNQVVEIVEEGVTGFIHLILQEAHNLATIGPSKGQWKRESGTERNSWSARQPLTWEFLMASPSSCYFWYYSSNNKG